MGLVNCVGSWFCLLVGWVWDLWDCWLVVWICSFFFDSWFCDRFCICCMIWFWLFCCCFWFCDMWCFLLNCSVSIWYVLCVIWLCIVCIGGNGSFDIGCWFVWCLWLDVCCILGIVLVGWDMGYWLVLCGLWGLFMWFVVWLLGMVWWLGWFWWSVVWGLCWFVC